MRPGMGLISVLVLGEEREEVFRCDARSSELLKTGKGGVVGEHVSGWKGI